MPIVFRLFRLFPAQAFTSRFSTLGVPTVTEVFPAVCILDRLTATVMASDLPTARLMATVRDTIKMVNECASGAAMTITVIERTGDRPDTPL